MASAGPGILECARGFLMPTANLQPSFAGGLISPALHGRVDLARYDTGLATANNVFVHEYGGVSNRPGTEFIHEVVNSAVAHRLIPFALDDDDSLVLVFGNTTMQVITNGAVVQSGGSDYLVATPFTTAQSRDMDYAQSLDVMYFAQKLSYPTKVSRAANDSWTFSSVSPDPTLTSPTISSLVTGSSAAPTRTYRYKVSAIIDGVESFPSAEYNILAKRLGVDNNAIEVYWGDVGADRYNIYRTLNQTYGFIGTSPSLGFFDDNYIADLTITPVEASGLWGAAGEYPRAVSMHQQRLIYGGSINQPETVWCSRVGDYENFTKSETTVASDRMEVDIAGVNLNTIEFFLPIQDLVIFTSGGEFTLTGDDGTLSATNPVIRKHSGAGISGPKPVLVNDTALFVDGSGTVVRDLRYALESDGYAGNNLSIFCPHIFKGRQVTDWAYASSPHSIVWVVLDNTDLVSFTYQREHQVWAWCEHDVGGAVESIASVPEGGVDGVYLLVQRTVNGSSKRYIERLHSRTFTEETPEDCFFVDCGLTYSGTAATSISGLDHLEGESVVALADGAYVPGLTVSSGSVTLPFAASKVHVGLPYTAEIETLPASIMLQDSGAARGRPHNITHAKVQLHKSRGVKMGHNELAPMPSDTTDLAGANDLRTGLFDVDLYPEWNPEGGIRIVQEYPLPMTVLGVVPEISIGRS